RHGRGGRERARRGRGPRGRPRPGGGGRRVPGRARAAGRDAPRVNHLGGKDGPRQPAAAPERREVKKTNRPGAKSAKTGQEEGVRETRRKDGTLLCLRTLFFSPCPVLALLAPGRLVCSLGLT